MNSVVIVNWEDKDFAERVVYTLQRQGFERTEDYECVGSHIQVWAKVPADNLRGRVIESDPLSPLKLIPDHILAARLIGRLATLMPEGTLQWQLEWAATNLAFDLMGKPG